MEGTQEETPTHENSPTRITTNNLRRTPLLHVGRQVQSIRSLHTYEVHIQTSNDFVLACVCMYLKLITFILFWILFADLATNTTKGYTSKSHDTPPAAHLGIWPVLAEGGHVRRPQKGLVASRRHEEALRPGVVQKELRQA